MKTNLKNINGYTLGAVDGEVGTITDFYFDDENWTIRYLVVETGNWLFGRKVLISTEALLPREWDAKVLPVNLTKEQIKTSPDIDTDMPVSRLHEKNLQEHYAWNGYLGTGMYGLGMWSVIKDPIEDGLTAEQKRQAELINDVHLRSANHIMSYKILATNGEIGEVVDFIMDDNIWKITYLIVDIGKWLPGKKVVLSPTWIHSIDWCNFAIKMMVSTHSVKNSPEYSHGLALSELYEEELKKFYESQGKEDL